MPAEIYEIVALAARFWFLFLMAMIVWRSYRWYARERRQRKKRLRLLPDAGYIGEFVVMQSAGDLTEGTVLSVPFEGTLGFVRSNDLCVPVPGVAPRHLWFSYDEKKGLVMTALGRNDFSVDELTIDEKPEGLCMLHGSRLYIGECELRLRMFAGYEVGLNAAYSQPRNGYPPQGWNQPPQGQAAYGYGPGAYDAYVPGQLYGDQQQSGGYVQPGYAYQQPMGQYPQGWQPQVDEPQPANPYAQAPCSPLYQEPEQPAPVEYAPSDDRLDTAYQRPQTFHPLVEEDEWDEYDDDEDEAYEDGYSDDPLTDYSSGQHRNPYSTGSYANTPAHSVKAAAQQAKQAARQQSGYAAQPQDFYPLESEEAWPTVPRPDEWCSEGLFDDLLDEDGTDASAPPKSAYVGRDESAWAKRRIWDKYFGGGDAP